MSRRKREEEVYPVFRCGLILGQSPIAHVNFVEREWLLCIKAAVSVKRGKAIQLLLAEFPKTPESLKMGPSVIEKAAAGSKRHQALRDAWKSESRRMDSAGEPRHPGIDNLDSICG